MKQLILITVPYLFHGEREIITRLFEEGLQRLHLRKPDCEEADLCRLLEEIPTSYHPQIVLHDHLPLAVRYGLGGVHLNRRNPHPPKGFSGTISRSCHTIEELECYKQLDYLFLSPIFASISKEGYGSGFPMEQLQEASEQGIIHEKIIALGGIDCSTLPQLRNLSFGGVAVLGAVWGQQPSIHSQDSIITNYKNIALWIQTTTHNSR